jgi:hypothetical protein
LVSFCGFVLRFPVTQARAEETPVSSATPAATAAARTPTATPAPSPVVRWVGVHDSKEERHVLKAYAGRGDEIWIDVFNFKDWLNSLEGKQSEKWAPRDLILYLNHVPLPGVHPFYWYEWDYYEPVFDFNKPTPLFTYNHFTVTTFGFSLVRKEDSRSAWSHLLNKPGFNRKVVVSVGFENSEEIRTQQLPDDNYAKNIAENIAKLQKERKSIPLSDKDALKKIDQQLQGWQQRETSLMDQQFYLTIIPKFSTAIGLMVILGALIAFLALARHTHIIRDPAAPRRPDGRRPYSLARGQMAFWFFLVIASYFFLWIVTGDMDTLNASVLALIGISAGTALGSAFVDAAKPAPTSSSGNQPIVDVTRPHKEVLAELKQLQADTQQELEALQKARTLISPSDKQALDENERQQNEVRKRLANYRWQSAYFGWPTWRGVLYDLLTENNQISFHRFQIFVWTLILGIIFVVNVYNELGMPEFSATLLGLLGISAGTYIGFKLPETKAS